MFHVKPNKMITLKHCPACNNTSLKPHLNCKDHTVSRETFPIVQCEKCTLLFTNPRPKEEALGGYYESEEYISHTNSTEGLFNKAYQAIRQITIKQKIKILGKAKGELLEIGCGTGELLKACQDKGWNCKGVEPNAKARTHASEALKLKIKQNTSELKLEENSQNRIMLWHVLEHLPNLNETIDQLSKWLHPKGQLIIAVPNPNSADAQHYQEKWAAYDVPRHLSHFTKESMRSLLKQHQLKIKEIKGMPFDAFYVSMLSEKIIHGKTNMLKGFFRGMMSNIIAQLNNKEYSSLIYIIEAENGK